MDLIQSCMEVYRAPQPKYGSYQRLEFWRAGIIAPERLPAASLDVAKLF